MYRLRVIMFTTVFAPLYSIRLRIRDPIAIHILLALVLARDQRLPFPVNRNVTSSLNIAVIGVVSCSSSIEKYRVVWEIVGRGARVDSACRHR